VASDDLNAPLGQKLGQSKKKWQSKIPAAAPQVLAGMLGLFGLAVAGWAMFVNDPLGGEPVAVIATKLPVAGTAKQNNDGDGKQHSRHDGVMEAAPDAAAVAAAAAAAKAPPPGAKTVTIIDGSSGKSQEVVIPGNPGAAPKATIDPKLLDTSRHGAIPKIGPDGTRPAASYARPVQVPPNKKDWPRIAIVIGGVGISASGTADAFGKLPAPVTFAFAPYGVDLEKMAAQALAENHEVLLQVPMEPFDYPDNDPGPQALLTSLSADQNVDRLQWLMSRFQGYVGIINYMGARFAGAEPALAPVLRETAKRGLIYVDDGSAPRSVASQIAGSHNLPFAKTDLVLDAIPTPIEIDRALARLEMTARDNGTAVGHADAQPATVARISEWTKKIEARGFVLVPISMVAIKPKSS
jgi:polysaccharide deacetylase 2 family uncharacterized protein YibQ